MRVPVRPSAAGRRTEEAPQELEEVGAGGLRIAVDVGVAAEEGNEVVEEVLRIDALAVVPVARASARLGDHNDVADADRVERGARRVDPGRDEAPAFGR